MSLKMCEKGEKLEPSPFPNKIVIKNKTMEISCFYCYNNCRNNSFGK